MESFQYADIYNTSHHTTLKFDLSFDLMLIIKAE